MDLRDLLKRYFETARHAAVVAAYLYGSYAEGRAHRESDLDVGVVLDARLSPAERFELRVRLIGEVIGALHFNEVDLIVLNDALPLLAARVVREGVPVYVGDPEGDHAFRRDIQLRAADLAPFIERYRRRLLEEVGR